MKESFLEKVNREPADQTVRAALSVIGRAFAAIRYLALPLALFPSGYRFGSDLFGVDEEVDFERLIEWPAGLLDEMIHVRAIVSLPRLWRELSYARYVSRYRCYPTELVGRVHSGAACCDVCRQVASCFNIHAAG